MKKILLVCSAGMSTSMLVKKMQMYATIKKLEFEIVAKGIAEAKPELSSYDAIMIGPQISYALDEIKKMAVGKPVELIPTQIYALAKGEDAIKQALKMLGL
ncbi:PTS system, cellobiose-specific IIB component [Spiroplasma litorale]|uniref:PTS system, cellobiose-specific IIB component n=1 Tax=Spiroplasma litorale TaxID=216942 RepID=A0A0K1W0W5_9MOLU|nr:PTS sugar transporter subunit IIB [Spiroplasma litorale]AKX33964.1 PTS system, cellobiose-specific IIB component [Spiroplasma litorale]